MVSLEDFLGPPLASTAFSRVAQPHMWARGSFHTHADWCFWPSLLALVCLTSQLENRAENVILSRKHAESARLNAYPCSSVSGMQWGGSVVSLGQVRCSVKVAVVQTPG